MRPFKQYLQECIDGGATLPAIEGVSDAVDLTDSNSRDPINELLSDLTEVQDTTSPEIVYERVRSILSEVGYTIPPVTEKLALFSEEDGEDIIPLLSKSSPCFLYFAFYKEGEEFEVWAEVVTESGLEEILTEDSDVA